MKKLLTLLLCISFMVTTPGLAGKRGRNPNPGNFRATSTAPGDTTWLASYTFDVVGQCNAQGWIAKDVTAQLANFWHNENFVGMSANYQGNVTVIGGDYSLWCGKRASGVSPYCGYAALPGYGNNWNQAICTIGCYADNSAADITFDLMWDSEPGYDATTLEVSDCGSGVWVPLLGGIGVWDGIGSGVGVTADVTAVEAPSGFWEARFHFKSNESWSDEDGQWDTDGWGVLDNIEIAVVDGGTPGGEDFEGFGLGYTGPWTEWTACTPPGFGDFSGVYNAFAASVVNEDLCNANVTCLWGFYSGSAANYACGGFPGQSVVPYENASGQYIYNEVWSPQITFSGSGSTVCLQFDVYKDLPLDALVFFTWRVRSIVAGCPGAWKDHEYVYYGGHAFWLTFIESVGDLIEPGATAIQVAFGVIDMFQYWGGIYGSGACHSHAPLFDNVEVYRVETEGPQWGVRDIDLFQDTFAADGTTTGTARLDAAKDILPVSNPNFLPGDSVTVRCSDLDNGLAADAFTGFGAAVYCYIAVWGPSGDNLASSGNEFEAPEQAGGFGNRYPYVASELDGGVRWYCFRMDTSFTDGTARTGAQPNAFAFDLNDNYFVPCDTICYYFCAISDVSGAETYWSHPIGASTDEAEVRANPGEITILPAGGWKAGGDILYVDHADDRDGPAQIFFDSAFDLLGIREEVDRYDILDQSAFSGNSLGSSVTNVFNQLLPCYRKIIWNSGSQERGLIGDGTGSPQKSDDALALLTFLDNLASPGGIYISGDNIAEEWQTLTGSAIPLKDTYIQHTLVNGDHVVQGFGVSPLVIGEPGSCFDHGILGVDTLIAYGGCEVQNGFDVLAPTGASTQEMRYAGGTPGQDGAVLAQQTLNLDSVMVGVILSGFDFSFIRDHRPTSSPARAEHLRDILIWLGNTVGPVTSTSSPKLESYLDDNYPNPFNPTTTIRYGVRERARVTIKVYNVAGQLVKTLVEGVKAPSAEYKVTWDGRNDRGQSVASGVYFYRLVTKDFSQTRKMVLLK
jgi:hypothetical protein